MNKTAARNSVLIYIAPRAHKFAVLGDAGIHEKCGEALWQSVVAKMRQVTTRAPRPSIFLLEARERTRLLEPGKFGLAELKVADVAEQWTLLDVQNFKAIQRREFLAPQAELRPNWERMLRRAAMFSRWVASEIVQQATLSQRVEVIKKFVQVALAFLELHNFNGLMSVWGGLNTTAVHRLSKTKKALPKKTQEIWQTLQTKLSEAQNFGMLRKTIEREVARGEPVLPWFELLVKLRNWADNYSDYITQHAAPKEKAAPPLLNFGKMYIVGEQLLAFDRYQRALERVDVSAEGGGSDGAARTYLEHLPCFQDDVLWKYSTLCESDATGLSGAPGSPGR